MRLLEELRGALWEHGARTTAELPWDEAEVWSKQICYWSMWRGMGGTHELFDENYILLGSVGDICH